ncbi:putative iron-sulfur cluster-binding metallochaperone [Lysinibacillus fusiformis]|uniref:putative iron-sulfur cluster-binding metallochaperone n=1 Tax=Lysinibacillus fusiformis TaxID=28031 RepID=UPI000E32F2EA|nr:copper chaperone Copz family protein [Lysinibacillus fusiformis]AXQ50905.1 (2Fe-2S)-binding protein [Stenotrophomonas rhizophila]KAB0447224.1 (2Fe-2S)-binding protein [Lysinibacillus fusiformis]
MGNCCSNAEEIIIESNGNCPTCKNKAKSVKLITLKSLLKPSALETLNAKKNHYFCSNADCDVVYFDTNNKKYFVSDIKVAVYQKEDSTTTPVCYCFDWTKVKLKEYVENELTSNPVDHIRENIKENRCGCEVNNPQGSCCLGNVTIYIRKMSQEPNPFSPSK